VSIAAKLDPATREYLARAAADGSKPLFEMQVDEARAFMKAGQTVRYGHPALTVESASVAGVPVRIIRPGAAADHLAVVLYLHGGGWVLGSPDTHAGIVQELALRTKAAFIVPDYALAPERPFPVAFEQCYEMARAIHGGEGPAALDSSRFALAGDSAGGNLAAAVALRAAEREDMTFRLQALICPALDPLRQTPSYTEFAEGFGLTAKSMGWFWSHYAPAPARLADPRLAPLRASHEAFAQAPPAFILSAGCDVLRDEAELYASRLWDAGTSATLLRVPGAIHNFPVIDELRATPAGQAAVAAVADALNRALSTERPEIASVPPQRIHSA
jgi:acetyl esterase